MAGAPDSPRSRKVLEGVPVSPGIAVGSAWLLHPRKREIPRRSIAPEQIEAEIARLRRALDAAGRQVRALRERIGGDVGEYEARIFDSHALILRDEEILAAAVRDIRENLLNAEQAFHRQMNVLADRFDAAAGGFLKEHLIDLRDVAARVIDILTLADGDAPPELRHPVVLLARALTPSGLSQFAAGNLLGLCLETGGKASHTAILARSLGIPAVSGLPWADLSDHAGGAVIVDGDSGRVILNPTLRDIKEHENRRAARLARERELESLSGLEPVTRDGKHVALSANVERPEEAGAVLRHGAGGVGLYRSEFLFLGREEMPGEEEQYRAYRALAGALAPRSVTIRTLDAGGDKQIPGLQAGGGGDERNPHMGWRSIRVSLRNPEPFKAQLRAILRAGAGGNVRLMFPMITNLREFRAARAFAEEARAELAAAGVPHAGDIETGCMIEVPSAALLADDLAREADFFSIGTNDLAQFTLAVDRANERVSDLLEPHSPAVLREIRGVVNAARAQGIPVSICGEMAADPHLALLFVGMGVDELSMSPAQVPEIKRLIRAVGYEEARECAREAVRLGTAEEVHAWVEERFKEVLGRSTTM